MVPVMQQIFVYGKKTIPYSVLFSARRTLGIKVYPSGEVVLLAPEGTPEEVIEQKLHKRAPWILRQQAYFKDFGIRSPEKRYVSGESHYYLGKQFLLRVSEGKTNSVRYKGRCFEVVCTSPDKARELMKSANTPNSGLPSMRSPSFPDLHGTELLRPHSMFRRWKTVGAAAPPRGKSF